MPARPSNGTSCRAPDGENWSSGSSAANWEAAGSTGKRVTCWPATGPGCAGSGRFTNVEVGKIAKAADSLATVGVGRATGMMEFGGRNIRSVDNLTGTVRATLGPSQALQLPVLKEIVPFLGPGRSAATVFKQSEVRASLNRGGMIRVERLALAGPKLSVFAEGMVNLARSAQPQCRGHHGRPQREYEPAGEARDEHPRDGRPRPGRPDHPGQQIPLRSDRPPGSHRDRPESPDPDQPAGDLVGGSDPVLPRRHSDQPTRTVTPPVASRFSCGAEHEGGRRDAVASPLSETSEGGSGCEYDVQACPDGSCWPGCSPGRPQAARCCRGSECCPSGKSWSRPPASSGSGRWTGTRELDAVALGEYVVGSGDGLLAIPVNLESPARVPSDLMVQPDGIIDLGQYGPLRVVGKTVVQIEAEVNALVAAQTPGAGFIDVRLVNRESKKFYVAGEVNAPGSFPYTGEETVLDAVTAAGGLNEKASRWDIILSRPTPPNGCRVILAVNYWDILQLGDTTTNYKLLPGDRVYVPTRTLMENLCGGGKKFWKWERRPQVSCPLPQATPGRTPACI